jgi:vancomycin permeability regulator SanA
MRIVAFTVCGLLLLYIVAFLSFALLPRRSPADLAVVFGSAVLPGGTPSPRLAARLEAAIQAYRANLVPLIMVSGGRGASGYDEAATMHDTLRQAGIPETAILSDPDGNNTRATVAHAVAVMQARHLLRVMIVTQYFHIPRCDLAFRQRGITGISAAWPYFLEWRDFYSTAREMLALPAYAVAFR